MTATIKSIFTTSVFLLVATHIQAQVGIGTSNPSPSAKLQVDATNKGFLPPRVTLTGTADVSTISNPATGLLVYNTTPAGSGATAVTAGYYYYSGSAWVPLTNGVNAVGSIAGSTNVNGATISGTTISLTPADGTNGGIVTTGDQTFSGAKTFNSDMVVNQIRFGRGLGGNEENTAVGYDALTSNTSGSGNTAFGFQGQWKGTTGQSNTSLGFAALIENTTGSHNTALGYQALQKNIGSDNIAIGSNAMYLTENSSNNIVIGGSSFDLATVNGSNSNVVIGKESLRNATTASQNIVFGHASGAAITTEANNTLIGHQTNISAGTTNATAIGYGATVSSSNTIQLGNSSIVRVLTSGNLGIGTSNPTTMSNYVIQTINGPSGSFTEYQENGSNAFRIGSDIAQGGFLNQTNANPIRIFTNSSERMRITNDGKVGIGTTSPATLLSIGRENTANEGGQIDLHESTNNAVKWSFDVFKTSITPTHALRIIENGTTPRLQLDPGGTSWVSPSDARLKNILNTWESDDQINFVEYQWKNDNSNKSLFGYLAQDVQKVFPAAVSESQDGMLAVDYTEVHSFKISNLERKNSDQEKRIKELEQTVEELKKMIKRKRTRR